MGKSKVGLLSKVSQEANSGYTGAKTATADEASGNQSPTMGKNIPIISGGAKPKGEVIWIRTRLAKDNSCRGDIAVCFGRNPFGRPLSLRAIALGGVELYARHDGSSVNPPHAIRFYDGTQTEADPLIVEVEGASVTPAWTGYIYAVIEDVLLRDGDFTAEFTDNATIGNSSHSRICDPSLEGIDLVPDERTGLFYGLRDPMSGQSSIIVSDGCRIISEVRIHGIMNSEYIEPGTPNDLFYCDAIFPLPCRNMVVITGSGSGGERPTWESFNLDGRVSYSPIFNPYTGKPVWNGKTGNYDLIQHNPDFPRNGLGKEEVSVLSGWGIDWKVGYELPGIAGGVAYLRTFDPSDVFTNSDFWLDAFSLPAPPDNTPTYSGNVAIHIVNDRTGEMDYWYQDVGRARTNASPWRPKIDDWNVRDFPEVDEFLWCKTGVATVTLAGVKHSGGASFTVYVLEHSEGGISTTATASVSLPSGWTSQGLNYDKSSERIVVGANKPSDPLVSGRVYYITLTGIVSFKTMGDGFTRVIGKPYGVPSENSVPITNDDYSKLGALNLDTGETTVLYDDEAPTTTPTVDLSRDVVSLPTVDGIVSYAVSQVTTADIALADLITDICTLKGYDPADLVFEGFTGLVARGMTISTTTKVADLLNKMGQLYGFVFAETDGKLKFRNRRNADGSVTPDWTLTAADLVEAEENITVQRQAGTSVLGSLSLTWLDPDRGFESNNILARRFTGVLSEEAGTRDEEISLPLAIDQETARQALFRSFYAMAEGETRVGFSVGPKFLRIEPGDLVEITADGSTRLVQVRRVTHRADLNTLDIEADLFMAQATPDIGSAGGGVTPPDSGAISGAYIHLDMPLVETDDYPGAGLVRQYHGLTTFDAESWGGADLYRSADDTNYLKLLEYDVAPIAVATAIDAMGECPQRYCFDAEATLNVRVVAGDSAAFETVSYYDMNGGVSLCAYGRPGAWELVAYQTVTENIDGTLTLTGFQRGLYGTQQIYFADGEAKEHAAGDFLVRLDPALLRSTVRPVAEIGRTDRYAVVTADVDLTDAVKPKYVMPGVSMRPPPVANVLAEHEAGSNDLVVTFDKTTPIPHTWEDTGASVETPEAYTYTVKIITAAHGTFTFTTTDATYTWTAYGSTIGASVSALGAITDVTVMVTSPALGDSYTTSAFAIRET